MEKTWETFWTTGKVTDYLTYRNEVTDAAGSGDLWVCRFWRVVR